MGSDVVDEDEPGCSVVVRLDDEVLGDSVVEVDELCWTVILGLEDVDEFGDGVVEVGSVCFSVVADVGELIVVAGVALVESGFCIGVDSLVGDV